MRRWAKVQYRYILDRTGYTAETWGLSEGNGAGVCMAGTELTREGTQVAYWRALKSFIRSFHLIKDVTTDPEHLEEQQRVIETGTMFIDEKVLLFLIAANE